MWSPPIAAAESSSSSGLYLCSYSLQARKSKGINVPTSLLWVERNIVVPTTNRYSLTGNPAIKSLPRPKTSPIRLLRQLFGLQGLLRSETAATA
jgi:hypothetical protein